MIETSSGLSRKSSAIFGNFLKMFGNVRLAFDRDNFGKSSKLLGKSFKTPSSVCFYNNENITG